MSGMFPEANGRPVDWKALSDHATDATAVAYSGLIMAEATAVGLV